jgi:hypothetical protein
MCETQEPPQAGAGDPRLCSARASIFR